MNKIFDLVLPPSNFYPILLSLKNTELNFVWEKIKQSILKVVPTPSLCFSIIVSYCNNFVPHLSSINPMVGYSNYALQAPPIAYWLFESYLPGPPPQYPTKVIIYIYMLQPPPTSHAPLYSSFLPYNPKSAPWTDRSSANQTESIFWYPLLCTSIFVYFFN